MKVLFVCSANKRRLGHNCANQYQSIQSVLPDTKVFGIVGKGFWGYFRNILSLKQTIKKFKPDIIHAHYSLCGYVATLTGFRPIVVSLMGSDCQANFSIRLIRLFHKLSWKYIIVKSKEMYDALKITNRICILPNGVDLSQFPFIDKSTACEEVGFAPNKFNIVFVGDPDRKEKNFKLASKAVEQIKSKNVEFHTVWNVPHSSINNYLRSADVLLMTSLHEGSPNVIKEAMACNLPIVSTEVGDVSTNLKGLSSCFVVKHDPFLLAKALTKVMISQTKPDGLERLKSLSLTADKVRDAIIDIYIKCLPDIPQRHKKII